MPASLASEIEAYEHGRETGNPADFISTALGQRKYETRFYAYRIVGCDRYHRDSRCDFDARFCFREKCGQANYVRFQSKAVGIGVADVRRR